MPCEEASRARWVTPPRVSPSRVLCKATGSGVVNAPATGPEGATTPSVPSERGLFAERGPNLTHEIGDRGLSARSGDRNDGFGLELVHACRRVRQRAPDIRHLEEGGRLDRPHGRALGDDRGSAVLNRLRCERDTVRFLTRHREKNHVLRYRAAVGADALYLVSGQGFWNVGPRKQFAEAHQCSPPPCAGTFASP